MREQYRDHPLYEYTEFIDKHDAPAFDPDAETYPLAFFEPMVERVFARPKKSMTCARMPTCTTLLRPEGRRPSRNLPYNPHDFATAVQAGRHPGPVHGQGSRWLRISKKDTPRHPGTVTALPNHGAAPARHAYGSAPQQTLLALPAQNKSRGVLLLVHGCWSNAFDRQHTRPRPGPGRRRPGCLDSRVPMGGIRGPAGPTP